MIARLAKDYRHYEILYESQEEAQAVVDYLEVLLLRGVDIPNKTTVETFKKTDAGKDLHKVSGVMGKAEWQEKEDES